MSDLWVMEEFLLPPPPPRGLPGPEPDCSSPLHSHPELTVTAVSSTGEKADSDGNHLFSHFFTQQTFIELSYYVLDTW